MLSEKRFYEAAEQVLPFRELLLQTPRAIAREAVEIRIRSGRPLVVETTGASYICGNRTARQAEIAACVECFCGGSVHSYEKELAEGCVTLKGGHRAGFAGTAHTSGQVEAIREYTSVDLRIAREHIGAADGLFEETALKSDFCGLLIIGPPLSAKTTVLRDYCRRLGAGKRTALLDERGEIAAMYRGEPQNDVGLHTDVLTGFSKRGGIERAIRLLSPEYLVCDEIGADFASVLRCANRGVKPVLTEHCGGIAQARRNAAVTALTRSGAVNYIALLGGGNELGRVKEIRRVDDAESFFGDSGGFSDDRGGQYHVRAAEKAR